MYRAIVYKWLEKPLKLCMADVNKFNYMASGWNSFRMTGMHRQSCSIQSVVHNIDATSNYECRLPAYTAIMETIPLTVSLLL